MGAFAFQGGDWRQYIARPEYGWSRPIVHIREPGAVWLWQAFAHGYRKASDGSLGRAEAAKLDLGKSEGAFDPMAPPEGSGPPSGAPFVGEPGFRIVGFWMLGAFSGGLFCVCVLGFLREIGGGVGARAWIAALPIVASLTLWVFFKHFEFYAPLYVALVFYGWMGVRYFRTPTFLNFALLMLAVFIAINMHRVAAFHLPALLLAFHDSANPRRFRPPTSRERGLMALVIAATALLHIVPIYLAMSDRWNALVFEDYNWFPELLTPWTQGWLEYVREHSKLGTVPRFTFASLEHAKHFLFFLLAGSPVAIVVIAAKARRISGPEEKFLLVSALCAWAWALVWHPHLSYGDWDLFMNPAVPTNLLAAILLLKTFQPADSRTRTRIAASSG